MDLNELIENQIRYRFARLPGVAQVDLWGGYNREIRIELNPDRLKALGLPLDAVIRAIRDANLDLPAGKIEEGSYEVTLRAPAEFQNLDDIRNAVISRRGGTVIRLNQIATVRDTYEKLSRVIRIDGEQGLFGLRFASRRMRTRWRWRGGCLSRLMWSMRLSLRFG